MRTVASFGEPSAALTWWNAASLAHRSTVPEFRTLLALGAASLAPNHQKPGRLRAEWPCYLCAIFTRILAEEQIREGKGKKQRKAPP
jgi:hypothetical protein